MNDQEHRNRRKLKGDDLIIASMVRLERAAKDYAKDAEFRGAEQQLHEAAVAYAVTLLSVRGGLTESED